jgi:hypothetical protein
MGHSVSELFIAAGYATPDDPLLDIEESWVHMLSEVQTTPEFLALAEPQQIIVIGVLHAAHLRDSARRAQTVQVSAPATIDQDRDGTGVEMAGEDSDEIDVS